MVASTQIASAADMPVKAPPPAPAPLPYNWGGLYLGGHFGYLWGRTRVEEEGVVTEPNAATNGVIGGVLAGYNWQAGPWVFGLEATSAGLMRTVRERPFSSFSRIRTT
jgi:outer membrane immunogenic protein